MKTKIAGLLMFIFISINSKSQLEYPPNPVTPEIELPQKKSPDTESKPTYPQLKLEPIENEYSPTTFVNKSDVQKVSNSPSFKENPQYNPNMSAKENEEHYKNIDSSKSKEDIGIIIFYSFCVIASGAIIFLIVNFLIKPTVSNSTYERIEIEQPKFNIGSIVVLISGGPTMTVIQLNKESIKCAWFENGNLKEAMFNSNALKSTI